MGCEKCRSWVSSFSKQVPFALMERKRDQDDFGIDILAAVMLSILAATFIPFAGSKPIRPEGAHWRRQPGEPIGRLRGPHYGGRSNGLPDVSLWPADRRFRPIPLP